MLHVLVTLSVVGLGGLLHPVAPPPVTTGLVGPLVLLNVLVWRQFFEAGGVPFALAASDTRLGGQKDTAGDHPLSRSSPS